jgi:hypothetical protein
LSINDDDDDDDDDDVLCLDSLQYYYCYCLLLLLGVPPQEAMARALEDAKGGVKLQRGFGGSRTSGS